MSDLPARKPMSKRLRFEVFKRDLFTCQYCGRTPPAVVLHIDHIVAVAAGGSNKQSNLVTACADCNLAKSDRPLGKRLPDMKAQAALMKEREAQIAGYAAVLEAQRERIDDEAWQVAARLGWPNSISRARLQSLRTFVRRAPLPRILEAADIACARDFNDDQLFRYFCGIAWNFVRECEAGRG